MYGVQSIVLCSDSVTDYYGEWLYKKRATEAVNSTTPTLSPQSSTSCVHSQDNDSCSGETGSVPGAHQHNNTIMEPLVRYYVYTHAAKTSKWRLLHTRDTEQGRSGKACCKQVKMQHNQSRGITDNYQGSHHEGCCDVHFMFKGQKTIAAPGTTFPAPNPPSGSHSG